MGNQQIWFKNTVFPPKSIFENYSFTKTSLNFYDRFEDTRIKTSSFECTMLFDYQAAHIYKYMGQNISKILGVFEAKKIFYATKAKIVGLGKECRLLRINEI